jgi:hypothetical protein
MTRKMGTTMIGMTTCRTGNTEENGEDEDEYSVHGKVAQEA